MSKDIAVLKLINLIYQLSEYNLNENIQLHSICSLITQSSGK